MSSDDQEFDEDQIKNEIKDAVEKVTQNQKILNVTAFKDFSREILDEVSKELLKKKRMFKYSVTVFLQQKNGAAMSFGSAMYVDNTKDGQVSHIFSENEHYDLLVCVAGYKITQK